MCDLLMKATFARITQQRYCCLKLRLFKKYSQMFIYAGMAELADAHGSGPCESNFMQVQLLLPAPKILILTNEDFYFLPLHFYPKKSVTEFLESNM